MGKKEKGQSALEYLMVYGWALIVIVVAIVALFFLVTDTFPVNVESELAPKFVEPPFDVNVYEPEFQIEEGIDMVEWFDGSWKIVTEIDKPWRDGHWECTEEKIVDWDYLNFEDTCSGGICFYNPGWGIPPWDYECISYHEDRTVLDYCEKYDEDSDTIAKITSEGIIYEKTCLKYHSAPACEVAKKAIYECTREVWVRN